MMGKASRPVYFVAMASPEKRPTAAKAAGRVSVEENADGGEDEGGVDDIDESGMGAGVDCGHGGGEGDGPEGMGWREAAAAREEINESEKEGEGPDGGEVGGERAANGEERGKDYFGGGREGGVAIVEDREDDGVAEPDFWAEEMIGDGVVAPVAMRGRKTGEQGDCQDESDGEDWDG